LVLARDEELPRTEAIVADLSARRGHALDPRERVLEGPVLDRQACPPPGHKGLDAPRGDRRVVVAAPGRVAPAQTEVLRRLEKVQGALDRLSLRVDLRDGVGLG